MNMIGLVRNEWKKVFLPVLLTTVLLAIAIRAAHLVGGIRPLLSDLFCAADCTVKLLFLYWWRRRASNLTVSKLPFLFSEKMDWGRFDCSHSDGCSNWGNSSVWYRITFRQRMEPCCGCNGSRVIFHSGTAFCQSLAGVCLFYPLSAYWKLADIWNLYVDWTFHWEKVDDSNCNRSLCPLGCVDQASGNSKYSADEF